MKLSYKMIGIGAASVSAMIILFTVTFFSGRVVKSTTEISALRNEQLAMTNGMQNAQTELLLAAMDSIIDKDDGKISDERMASINETSNYLLEGLVKTKEAADTDEEKKLAADMEASVNGLIKGIKSDLATLITESGRASVEIQAAFDNIDNTLDEHGGALTEALAMHEEMVAKRYQATKDPALFEVIDLCMEMQINAIELILAAMDSIIDRAEGKIDDERMAIINERSAFLTNNINKLASHTEGPAEEQMIAKIRAAIPGLIKGVKVDLVDLIENAAAKEVQLVKDFENIDDVLDESGDKLFQQLSAYEASIKEEVNEASESLNSSVSTSSMISMLVFIIATVVLIALITMITRSILGPINEAVTNMTSGSEQVADAAGQVSSSSQSLAQGASEQAASLEETSASMEEMTSMTKQNADNATQADALMREALGVITEADRAMDEMSTSMEEISVASDETSKIIKTIDEIAFQTNLLALNAAVEAARAGEAGAGFAVVADEVRNLAMRAAEASKNTAQLIEGTVDKVNSGKEIVTKTNAAFKEVAESSTKVGTLVGEISAASKEQSTGYTQIGQAVSQMDEVTQQNSATAEEAAAASEELNAQAEIMMVNVKGLRTLVEGIDKDVTVKAPKQSSPVSYERKPAPAKHPALAQPQAPAKAESATKPEDIIPMDDDDDFEDF